MCEKSVGNIETVGRQPAGMGGKCLVVARMIWRSCEGPRRRIDDLSRDFLGGLPLRVAAIP